jgi:hypothetical protein
MEIRSRNHRSREARAGLQILGETRYRGQQDTQGEPGAQNRAGQMGDPEARLGE